jgi:hypothetical protein
LVYSFLIPPESFNLSFFATDDKFTTSDPEILLPCPTAVGLASGSSSSFLHNPKNVSLSWEMDKLI